MKKMLLMFSLVLLATAGFAQIPLKPVKIDSLVTVSLPKEYKKKDTLGQSIYSANGSFGYMVVIRAPNKKNNTPLDKERDLNNVLKDYIKGIKGQSAGSTENVRDTTIGHLKAKTFTLETDEGQGVQLRNFIVIYTREVTYTFEYFYEALRKDLVKDEYRAYSSSIKLSQELQRNDQYLSNAKGISPALKYGLIAGGVVIVIIIILVLARKKRK